MRADDPVLGPAWTVEPVSLEDLVLAYMGRAGGGRAARAKDRRRVKDRRRLRRTGR